MEFEEIETDEELNDFLESETDEELNDYLDSRDIEIKLHLSDFQSRLQKALEPDGPETPKQVLDDFLEENGCLKRYFAEPPAVILCAETNKIELLTLLFESGLDLEQRDRSAWTPLHVAVESGHEGIVTFLLSKWASVNPSSPNETAPLHLAAQGTSLEIVKLLVEEGAMVDCYDIEGYTPLLHACKDGNWEIASFLVEKGADVNARGSCGKTPLLFVASAFDVSVRVLSDLLTAKANVHARNDRGETPLHAILDINRYYPLDFMSEAIEMLVTYGCDVNARTILGYTPLHKAVISEDETAVLALIKAGCSVDIKTEHGLTPMSYAINNNSYRLMELLLAAGASMSFSEWMDVEEVLRMQDPSMLERMRAMMFKVPKLLTICRSYLIKRYGREFPNRIDDWELPTTLKRYLAFETS